MLVSDAHKGIIAAAQESFLGTVWQRCKVHFMRNILSKTPHKYKQELSQALSLIFSQKDISTARNYSQKLINKYKDILPEAMDCLSEGLEDSLQFYNFKNIPPSDISSNNHLERINREIRRRSKVVGIFPSLSSFLR